MIASDEQMCFIPFNSVVRFLFDPVDPFAANGFLAGWKTYNGPSVVFLKSRYFFGHGFPPISILYNFMIGSWFCNFTNSC